MAEVATAESAAHARNIAVAVSDISGRVMSSHIIAIVPHYRHSCHGSRCCHDAGRSYIEEAGDAMPPLLIIGMQRSPRRRIAFR